MATAVQDVGGVAHQQREAVGCHRTQIGIVEQREELQNTQWEESSNQSPVSSVHLGT